MRVYEAAADWLIDRFCSRLNSGTLVIYSDSERVLAQFQFQAQAFLPAVNRVALANDVPPTVASASGDAVRAQLVTSLGEAIAEVPVKDMNATDVELGDILVERTDFHRGGTCVLGRATLSLPLRS
jgi:hypothetical protein